MAPSNSRRGSRRATFQDEPMFELLRQKYSIDRKYSTQSLKIKKKLERLEPTPTNRLRPSASESDLQKGVTITLKSLKRTGHSPRRGTRGSDAPYKEGKVSIADSKNERKQPQRIVGRGSHGISSATSPTRASRGISGATSPTRAARFFSGATSPSPIHLQRAMSTVTPLQLKRSMSHEEGKDHWNPERGMAVTIRGANPSSHLLLEDPYKGTIGHMINQRFWWVSDEKGRFKVIPLAKIRPRLDGHDSWFFQRRVTALANAKAVFDRHDEEKRRLQQQQLVDAIDQILKISLEIEEARTQFLAIMTDEEEKNAVLLYVNILTFKKTFGGRNFRSNHELGVPEIGGYETDNSADMRMRALEIYKGFIQENAPLSCAEFIAEETASKLRSILQNKQKKLRDTVFDDCAEDCLQFIEQTTWTELKKLWIILIQLWRKAFTRPGLETMDSRVKVLRNYMPKPFMRFYGSPAMCLIRDTHASEIPQWRSKINKGVESGTNPMRRGGTMKNSEEKEHVMCTWGDRINERALFKEGFLRKKFLTRGGYAKRYEEDVEEGSSALPRVMFCYYNTSDDEDAGLKADLKMPIDEHFSSSNYEKEHHSVNAMVELSSNGLTLRAKSPDEAQEWIIALSRFIPTTKHIDLTLQRVLEHTETMMSHIEDFSLKAISLYAAGTPFGSHAFLFRKFPNAREINRNMVTVGLLGTLRDFFAEDWDPAFASAWRFYDQMIGAVRNRMQMTYQKHALKGEELVPFIGRRNSLLSSFKALVGKITGRSRATSLSGATQQVAD